MPTIEEVQELANRGLQDQLPPEKREIFDELVRRGSISIPDQVGSTIITEGQTQNQEQDDGGIFGSLGRVAKQIDEAALGIEENALSFVTSLFAEGPAGIAGLAKTITSGPEEGDRTLNEVRDALTFQPRSQQGLEYQQSIAETLQPIGEFITDVQDGLGNAVFEKTGSPILAATAASAPLVGAELLGFMGTSKVVKNAQRKTAGKEPITDKQVRQLIKENAPIPDELFTASNAVYKEVSELGARIIPQKYSQLVDRIKADLKKGGFRERINTDVAVLVDDLNSGVGRDLSLDDLTEIRTVAQGLAKKVDPQTQALGNSIIDNIDKFLDSDVARLPEGSAASIGPRLKEARSLWNRARKGQEITDIFQKAKDAPLGQFEDTLRQEFKKLRMNRKRLRFFNKKDRQFIKNVAVGGKPQRILDFVGAFGLQRNPLFKIGAEGAASVLLGAQPVASLAIIGTVSKSLANRLRRNNGKFADAVIRSGKDAQKVVRAYLENTPNAERRAEHLSQLLLRSEIDLSRVKKPTPFVQSAIEKAETARKALLSAGATGAGLDVASQQGGS